MHASPINADGSIHQPCLSSLPIFPHNQPISLEEIFEMLPDANLLCFDERLGERIENEIFANSTLPAALDFFVVRPRRALRTPKEPYHSNFFSIPAIKVR